MVEGKGEMKLGMKVDVEMEVEIAVEMRMGRCDVVGFLFVGAD